jgi:hypothetical protein
MSLCWKCGENLKNVEGYDLRQIVKHLHCHHNEPEEKPKEKCWCHDFAFLNSFKYPVVIEDFKYCPKCGKCLNA